MCGIMEEMKRKKWASTFIAHEHNLNMKFKYRTNIYPHHPSHLVGWHKISSSWRSTVTTTNLREFKIKYLKEELWRIFTLLMPHYDLN